MHEVAFFWYHLESQRSCRAVTVRPEIKKTEKSMATKKKKAPQMSRRQQRRMRTQQIVMGVIAVLLVLAFILPSIIGR